MSEYTYVFTKGKKLSDAKVSAMTDYISDHYDSIIKIGDYYFDVTSLNHEIILNHCLDCENYQKENCCGGNPYPLVDEQQNKLLKIFPEMIKCMPEETRPTIHYNLFDDSKVNPNDLFNKHNTFKSCKDRCMFKDYIDGLPRCVIHYYCLQNELNPMEYKPYICSLFPIFVIETPSGDKYVFNHTKETSGFSLYWWTLGNRPCIIKSSMEKVVAQTEYRSKYYYTLNRDNIIKDNILDSYHPVWVEQESVMKYFFGEDTYTKLVELMQTK